jgi:hypothetical protein
MEKGEEEIKTNHSANNDVYKKLVEERNYRKMWAGKDFKRLQIMSWTAIGASFLSAILIASPLPPSSNFMVAALAAIPAFLVAAESGMNYGKRNRMNEEAYLEYESFLFRLEGGEGPGKIFEEFIAYRKQFARDFPSGSVLPTISPSPDTT